MMGRTARRSSQLQIVHSSSACAASYANTRSISPGNSKGKPAGSAAKISSAGQRRFFRLRVLTAIGMSVPWEQMQANDDALRFAETLRMAMKRLESQRTDAETR
jgi:hypothetical protein